MSNNKSILYLEQPTLFLEFYVREFLFTGKGIVRTKLPKDAFFYTGKSKVVNKSEYTVAHGKTLIREKADDLFLGFDKNKPYLSTNIPEKLKNKYFTENTNVIGLVAQEYNSFGDYYRDELVGKWHRLQDKIISNKYAGNYPNLKYANFKGLSPYHFNLKEVMEDGTIKTDFPNKDVLLEIKPFKTLCFLYRREEYSYCDYYEPNLNLVFFVKNYGFHNKIEYKKASEMVHLDSNRLCLENFAIRDFRK